MRFLGCCVAVVLVACAGKSDERTVEHTVEIQCVDLPAVADASINSAALNQNTGAKKSLQAGGKEQSLVRFNLSAIPPNQVVQSAALKVYVSGGPTTRLFVHRATAPWTEATVTFASFAQNFESNPEAFLDIDHPDVQKWVQLDAQVQRWLQGIDANNGLLLRSNHNGHTTIVSREGGTASQHPLLRVCYSAIDYCAGDPCNNGGTCENNPNGFTCQCAPGWEGATCDQNIDDCASAPCANGGTCTDTTNGFSCACAPGFTGVTCATNIDECAAAPCANGGVCVDGIATYSCVCPTGYEGVTCQTQTNNCGSQPCQNGGTCTNGVGTYTCACPAGFSGVNCETNIDDCAAQPCHNGGTCVDYVEGYTCSCPPDWGGAQCDINLTTCAQNPCLNGAYCSNTYGGYICACAPGYTGPNCETDINNCSPNPCLTNETCTDGVNTHTCTCAPGDACGARALAFVAVPATVTGGNTVAVTVQARDLNDVLAADFTGPIQLALLTSAGAIVSTTTANAVGGSVTQLVTFPLTPGTYLLRATSAGLTPAVSASINVPASNGPGLAFVVAPVGSVRSGDAFQLQVHKLLAGGVLDTAFNGNVTVEASAVGGSNFVGGAKNAAASGGVATFTVVLNNAADGYIVQATAAGQPSAQVSFDVTARQLNVVTAVANMQAGAFFHLVVGAHDANNSVAENFNGSVTLATAAVGGSSFSTTPVTTAVTGVAVFNALSLHNAADGYTITAQAAGLQGGTSNAFNVTATHLSVLPAANVRSGDAFNISVQARDALNNVAENFTGNVSLNAAAVGGSNFNGGTAAVASVAGVATFNGLALNNAADGYTSTATAAGLTNGSTTFNVTARSLVVTTALANVQAGTTFTATLEARDANNNLAENFAGNVTLGAVAVGGSSFSGGSAVSAAVAGTATFNGLVLNDAANGYAVTGSSSGLLTAVSNSFNVTATHLTVLATSNVRSGDTFNLVVQARDANGNVAENFAGIVSMSASTVGGSNFNGGTQAVAAAAGVATALNVALNNAADGYTVTATAAGLVGVASNPFNVTARQLVVTTAIASMIANTLFTATIEARDANNNLAENFAGTITLSASPSNFASAPAQAATAGSASFPNLQLSAPATGYIVTASAPGLIEGISNAFNVTP